MIARRCSRRWARRSGSRPAGSPPARTASGTPTARTATCELVTHNLLDDPAVHGLLINIRDVTERVTRSEALRASEQRYRLVFEGSRDAVIVVDQETLEITDANAAAAQMYGWPHDELVGLGVSDITTDAERAAEAIRAVGEETTVVRRRHRRRDGSELDVEIAFGSMELDGGSKVVAVVRDVTERIFIEQRFQALVEQSSDIIFVLDAVGTITYASPSVTPLLGYEVDEVLGRHATEFVIDEDVDVVVTEIARCSRIPVPTGGPATERATPTGRSASSMRSGRTGSRIRRCAACWSTPETSRSRSRPRRRCAPPRIGSVRSCSTRTTS